MKLSLLFHTVRYLKPIQIWGRLLHSLPRLPLGKVECPAVNPDFKIIAEINKHSSTSDGKIFTFLSESAELSAHGWNDAKLSMLWRYNLHYFDFLNQQNPLDKNIAKSLIHQWIKENPLGSKCGWDPYPTSLRIINWVKWLTKYQENDSIIVGSLWTQLLWLSQRPEYHLLGNHLFINAKAMIIGSQFFTGQHAEQMYKKGVAIVEQELDEQFLPDGAQFELSPMYHALAMEDLLEVYNVLNPAGYTSLKEQIKVKIQKGLQWLSAMTYNNGEYTHFNDTAQGIAPSLDQLKNLAGASNISVDLNLHALNYFKDAGYVVYAANVMKLIADVAKVGPDYLPGHAHADTLSFELAFGLNRVVVNHGVTCYGTSEQRQFERGTSAHSTVTINNENSSKVWSGFRVARRAYPFNVSVVDENGNVKIDASHNGYHRLKGSPTHTRSWLINEDAVTVIDQIQGEYQSAVVKYLLHPEVKVVEQQDKLVIFELKDKKRVSFEADQPINIVSSTYSQGFGKLTPTIALEIPFANHTKMLIQKH
jgi:uncharacterized heparinase superfamily protein